MKNFETLPTPENNAEKFKKLQDYVAKGYLLHGSKNRIEILEPRQAAEQKRGQVEKNMKFIISITHPNLKEAKKKEKGSSTFFQ